MTYQPKTGKPCGCRRGIERDNCPACEGTGQRIDFAAIRAASTHDPKGEPNEVRHTPTPWHRNVSPAWKYPIYADKNGNPDGRDWIHIAAVLQGNPNAEADLDFIVRAVNAYAKVEKVISTVARKNGEDATEYFLNAVNSHEALLEAAKELLAHEGERETNGVGIESDSLTLENIKFKMREAIALAESSGAL
jgi:hypothetical protein